MTNTTGAAAPGWYPDPAGSSQERWWSGAGWTDNLRAPQPVTPVAPANPYSSGAAPTPQWNATPEYTSYAPSNGLAIAGLVLSLVWAPLLGIIFSILGLRKAKGFEDADMPPVGRAVAWWGLGLGVAGMILGIAWGVFVVMLYFAQHDQPVGDSATARALEESIAEDAKVLYAKDVNFVSCPPTVSDEPGNVVDCLVVLTDGRSLTATTKYTEDGPSTSYSTRTD